MKIEVGKLYRTRDGRMACVLGIIDCRSPFSKAIGWVRTHGDQDPYHWDNNGRWGGAPCNADIVAEWEDPKPKLRAWILVESERAQKNPLWPPIIFCDELEAAAWNYQRAPWLDEPEVRL